MSGRARKPVTPRQPAAPRQPDRPRQHDGERIENPDVYKPKDYVVVLAIAPEMRKRYPDMALSLYEAAELGRNAERDREAGS
jgi:hypothetical protein